MSPWDSPVHEVRPSPARRARAQVDFLTGYRSFKHAALGTREHRLLPEAGEAASRVAPPGLRTSLAGPPSGLVLLRTTEQTLPFLSCRRAPLGTPVPRGSRAEAPTRREGRHAWTRHQGALSTRVARVPLRTGVPRGSALLEGLVPFNVSDASGQCSVNLLDFTLIQTTGQGPLDPSMRSFTPTSVGGDFLPTPNPHTVPLKWSRFPEPLRSSIQSGPRTRRRHFPPGPPDPLALEGVFQ